MRIIGITGHAGSGKTTLSNIISEKTGASVIHLDRVLDDIKNKKMMRGITENSRYTGAKMINTRLSDFIYDSPILIKPYLSIRKKIKSKILNKKIEEHRSNNEKVIIIEGIDLNDLEIKNGLDFLVKINVPYHTRISRIAQRDGILDKNFIVHRDQKVAKGLKDNKKPNLVVENNGTMEDLENLASHIINVMNGKEISSAEKYRKEMKFTGKLKGTLSNNRNNKNKRRTNETEKIYKDR